MIGVGLGATGSSRNNMINYGSIIAVVLITIQFFISVKFGVISVGVAIVALYGTAFIFNSKYKGLDEINSQIDSDNYQKHLENLMKKNKH